MNIEGVSIVLNAMLEVCDCPWLDESDRLLQITIPVPTFNLVWFIQDKSSVAVWLYKYFGLFNIICLCYWRSYGKDKYIDKDCLLAFASLV